LICPDDNPAYLSFLGSFLEVFLSSSSKRSLMLVELASGSAASDIYYFEFKRMSSFSIGES